MENNGMTPSRPYIFRAIYQWLCDNGVTPYMAVNAEVEGTIVPLDLVKDGQIVLNLAPHAIGYINIENHGVSFSARFNGVSKELYAPMPAIQALYAKENGQGMVFPPEDFSGELSPIDEGSQIVESDTTTPNLRSVDSSGELGSEQPERAEPIETKESTTVSSQTHSKAQNEQDATKELDKKDNQKKDRSHLKVIK
jgi:stringent starvation protein B